jgi:hypothetical protein
VSRDVVQAVLAGMSPAARASLLARNPGLLAAASRDACPPSERPALVAAQEARAQHVAQGHAARASGDAWEAAVYDALRALVAEGVVAWWGHSEPGRIVVDGRVRYTRKAFCDVVGTLAGGASIVAEVKRGKRVVIDPAYRGRDPHVVEHQAEQLTATADAGGIALLVVEVRGVAAVLPWREVRGLDVVTMDVARAREARSLVDALRREMEAGR